jgi:hypothetical protein
MDAATLVALAQLLSVLLPLGTKVYNQIQQANSDQLQPIADVLAAADKNWDDIIAAAKAELAKQA